MRRKRRDDLDTTLRDAYGYIRRQGPSVAQARAYYLWQRCLGERPTTFIAAGDGSVWRNDKVSLLADLRTIMLAWGMPPAVLARFDRAV